MKNRVRKNSDKIGNLDDGKKKLYKVYGAFRVILFVFSILILIFAGWYVIRTVMDGGEWSLLSAGVMMMMAAFLMISSVLFYLGLKNSREYLFSNNEKQLTQAKIYTGLSFVIGILFLLHLCDLLGFSVIFIIFIILYMLCLIFPSIITFLLCFNLDIKKSLVGIVLIVTISFISFILFSLSIVSPSKITRDISKLPTVVDFVAELRERNLLSPNYDLIGNNYLNVEKYQETDWYNGFSNIETLEENNKYSMYQYTDYENSINGMTIEWIIYSVNNKMYAYLKSVSADYERELTDSAKKYNYSKGIVVSEEEKLTTYNVKGKYYSYGGGIMKYDSSNNGQFKLALFGDHITEIDSTRLYMLDRNNSECANIVVVDEINNSTLMDVAYDIVS